MKTTIAMILTLLSFSCLLQAQEDKREFVKVPDMMKTHILSNMREHLQVVNNLLTMINADKLDEASELAEQELGMTALGKHGAGHKAQYFPDGMQKAGGLMHKAASRFARTAEEGDKVKAYAGLQEITAACVGCHAGYRLH